MTKPRHRWSEPLRVSSELSIRTCEKCGLVRHSHHDWGMAGKGRIGQAHWSEYFTEANPELPLSVMPECTDAERTSGRSVSTNR